MLKQELILAYQSVMKDNGWTYREVCKISSLSQSQLNNILRHEGRQVSIDKMEEGLYKLGFEIKETVWGVVGEEGDT